MKNLFKNLMLVAVAAMAFTACTETNEEVNAVVEKTVLKFVAGFDEETRSGFDGKNDAGTGYKSAWDGDEKLKVCTSGDFASAQEVSLDDAEGHFTVVFEGSAPASIDVYSPASAWNSEFYPTVPAVQTPRENSVDPAAHILRAQGASVESGVVTMQHMVAYGKMTVNGVDFAIDHVVVDIKGTNYGYDYDLSYTINATNVKNNEFWFAVEYAVEVSSLTVTAYGAGDEVVAKTVDMTGKEKPLAFSIGQVSTFSVSGLQAVVVEPEPEPDTVMDSAKYYYNYNNYGGYDNWGYVVFEDEFLGTLVLNCTFASGLYLDICTYTGATNSLGVRFDVGYSYYNVVGGTPSPLYNNYNNTMTVGAVDGKYSISFDVKNGNGETLVATYVGDIEGLGYPDLRTQLETPNVTATAEGNVINISWDPVTGADYYYVFCNIGGLEHVTTTETSVTIEAAYDTQYQFLIRAEANESNPDYRSSQDKYFDLTTDEDPNKWADVVATNIQWDNSNSCFTLTAPGFSYINLEVNSANRPNNNSLVVGDYTYGKNENQFRVKYNNGYAFGYNDISNTSTMTVDFVDGQYVILLDVTSLYGGFVGTIGYKGMPEGWDQPVVDTTPVIKLDPTSVELKRAGGSVDVNVTLKNITESIVAVSDNAQFTTSVNGNVVTISASENNTGADINGIVTISAGGVSAQVTVKQVAEDVVTEVTWNYVVDSSNSGTFGHMWNVSGNDLDGQPVSAQISIDSRYTTSSNFTAGTYNYHAQYADGNFGSGMYFTMRNIVFRGNSYSNYDVTGTITVVIEGGRTKITAEIYNLVNGYQTSKITTFVGYLN